MNCYRERFLTEVLQNKHMRAVKTTKSPKKQKGSSRMSATRNEVPKNIEGQCQQNIAMRRTLAKYEYIFLSE